MPCRDVRKLPAVAGLIAGMRYRRGPGTSVDSMHPDCISKLKDFFALEKKVQEEKENIEPPKTDLQKAFLATLYEGSDEDDEPGKAGGSFAQAGTSRIHSTHHDERRKRERGEEGNAQESYKKERTN